ncbi:hypothetical protein [uncultured Tateyamaria sp.]|uniref:hypothetical protein n=1 Tax=uncultured Tateyamaria sp. TaxID=455651 RepID=UPI00260F2A0C|nr:hypothetical protein [uncultured Tateyamaria sp.]
MEFQWVMETVLPFVRVWRQDTLRSGRLLTFGSTTEMRKAQEVDFAKFGRMTAMSPDLPIAAE